MPRWYASIGFTSARPLTEEATFDALDALTPHSAAISPRLDSTGAEVSMSVTAKTALDASSAAVDTLANTLTPIIGEIVADSIEILTEDALDKNLAEPVFPEVVSFAEIASMAGVSRQRARQFSAIDGFPAPVIKTAQGPLMTKAAVESWIENRNTRSGRPTASAV